MTTPKWLEETRMRAKRAHRQICELASGKRKWQMSIPVHEDDSDMVLQAPLDDLNAALDHIERLSSALREILSNVALDWYVAQFHEDETPGGERSGILAKYHNSELRKRASIAFEEAREALANFDASVGGKK